MSIKSINIFIITQHHIINRNFSFPLFHYHFNPSPPLYKMGPIGPILKIFFAKKKKKQPSNCWICVPIRAVESESRKVGKSLKIGSDFLSDFLLKMQNCHKMPKCLGLWVRVLHQNILIFNIFSIFKRL